MDFEFTRHFVPALIAAVFWFGGQLLLTLVVRPHRRDLRDGIAYIRRHHALSAGETDILNHLESTSQAVRSTAILSLAYSIALIMPKGAILRERDQAAKDAPFFFSDSKFNDIMSWYFISIFTANPLFGLIAIVLRCIWRIRVVIILRSMHDKTHIFELPSLDAAQKI